MNHVYTVTQINLYIKDMFARDYALNRIYVKGEVSNCKYHTSGHIYFTLKDSSGQMACVMFAGQRGGLAFRMQEGQSVVVLGSVSVYERDGKYQMYAREILLDGAGVLYQKFEELKKDMEKEGLFEQKFKKPIKRYPRTVGIVTAKTGAAIQDIMTVTARRNPYVQLVLYPALVQGEAASASIVKGIKCLDAYGVDTIIIGRGGGSIEDLWAFNEEIVARAIFSCNTPIISAVGHETDTTIADYVADLRAATPSAAAELVTGDIRDLFQDVYSYQHTLQFHLRQKLQMARNQLRQYQLKLEHASPLYQANQKRQYLMEKENRLQYLMKQRLIEKRHQLEILAERMKGVSPLDKLNKGYSVVTDEEHKIIRSVNQLSKEDVVIIEMIDGDVKASVISTQIRRHE
ncbi:exodeoxyribonuclease VII large subunit [Anaerosporobacter sp.]|uniref:exodeoxyribonuclease VII large subunit n=1 Tax=Anaerosporobacter sp. TaxID=1872529 RepID=UPI00286EE398|nr:exodeoxyribonuclease VII large subunit [Anaerosporobacter sp.]